jgi:gamma-glutamylcyclotransferase (GGCT)/AIG2-like uncharacterized protein YtfP
MQNTEKRLYIAYGSNLNKAQMQRRCADAKPVFKGWLNNYKLFYAGSKTGNYATVKPCKGEKVPVGMWLTSKDDEIALDIYEGYPRFYKKVEFKTDFNGKEYTAYFYVMRKDAIEGPPSTYYVGIVRQGYRDFGLDETYLDKSLEIY